MTPYVVRRRGGGRQLLALLLLPVWVAVALLVHASLWFLVLAVALAVVRFARGAVVLRVDADGVTMGDAGTRCAAAPWTAIEAVLLRRALAGPPRVAVRLRPDAPLPPGVHGIVRTPDRRGSTPPELDRPIPELDESALRVAVRGFGGSVPVEG